MNRIKAAWRALRGKITIKVPEQIYVYREYEYSNRFVQLLNHQGDILALDAEGKLWQIRWESHGFPSVQLVMESPRGSY
jgi:hypothetical protein